MHIAKRRKSIWKDFILYDSNCITTWKRKKKRKNRVGKKKIRGLSRSQGEGTVEYTEHRGYLMSETAKSEIIMMDIC